jgi:hypothetical protein
VSDFTLDIVGWFKTKRRLRRAALVKALAALDDKYKSAVALQNDLKSYVRSLRGKQ